MESMTLGNFVEIILAVGALGTTSMGIVEGFRRLKQSNITSLKIGEELVATAGQDDGVQVVGWNHIKSELKPFESLFTEAYGSQAWKTLSIQYAGKRKQMPRILRQGARIGLREENAPTVALALGWAKQDDDSIVAKDERLGLLIEAARIAQSPIPDAGDLPKAKQAELNSAQLILGQFETTVDARIEAALSLAENPDKTMEL